MRLVALTLSLSLALAASAQASPIGARVEELRRSFTLEGKPVPPEALGDLGDSDIADSSSIRVTIDLIAAVGSNLYADEIQTTPSGWISQTKISPPTPAEDIAYRFDGPTRNGLLVVTATFSSGGAGKFFTLNVLDANPGRGFDGDGKPYDRLNLTILRSIPLGDRWDGEIKISGDAISIVTARQPINHGPRPPGVRTVRAERP